MSGASVIPTGPSLDRGGEVPSSSRTSLEEASPEGGEGRNNILNNMIKSPSRDPDRPPSDSQCVVKNLWTRDLENGWELSRYQHTGALSVPYAECTGMLIS